MPQMQEALGRPKHACVEEVAQRRLTQSSYRPLQTVACHYREGVLVLEGEVPSFFHKQLAQEAIRHVEGVRRIDNQVEVRS